MNALEIVLLSFGLAGDAAAAAVSRGTEKRSFHIAEALTAAACFGSFQALMPLGGMLCGRILDGRMTAVHPFITGGILLIIGVKTLIGNKGGKAEKDGKSGILRLLIEAFATSADAFAAGIAFITDTPSIPLWAALLLIGSVTAALSFFGMMTGALFKRKFERIAPVGGAVILLILALHALIKGIIALTV